MPLKLKTVDVNGTLYAEVADGGKVVYVDDKDGKEHQLDGAQLHARVTQLNGESMAHRRDKEAAETKLAAFEGIDDPEAAKAALQTVSNLDQGQLFTAGKVDEIRTAAADAAKQQFTAAQKQLEKTIETQKGEITTLKTTLDTTLIGRGFADSKFIAEKTIVPPDMLQNQFGKHFKVKDGKVIAYDQNNAEIYSPSRPGELADVDEAIEILINGYAYKDRILKGSGADGAGTDQTGRGDPPKKNPFDKTTMNRTEASALIRSNPELARRLATQAGYSPINW